MHRDLQASSVPLALAMYSCTQLLAGFALSRVCFIPALEGRCTVDCPPVTVLSVCIYTHVFPFQLQNQLADFREIPILPTCYSIPPQRYAL
jgi:hypothetical protein